MKAVEEITNWKKNDGGFLVRVEFTDGAGFVVDSFPDEVVGEFKMDATKLAFVLVGGERVHAFPIEGIQKDGDEWVVTTTGKRIIISPLWLPEQRKEVREWVAAGGLTDAGQQEMEALFDAL